MKKHFFLLLVLSVLTIPTKLSAYTMNEIVKKDGLIYQVIDLANFKLSFVGAENSVSGAITVPATFNDGKGTTFTVTKVGGNDTYSCINVTKVALSEGITAIDYGAFGGATLDELNIPASVTSINHTAFYRVKELPKFTVAPGSSYFSSDDDGCLYSSDKKDLYAVPSNISIPGGTYTVNSSVEKIFVCAFTKTKDMQTLKLPANLQSYEIGYPSVIPQSLNLAAFEITSGGSTPYRVIDGVLFKGESLLCYPPAKTTVDYVVPDGITNIERRAINDALYMKTIDMNDVVTLNLEAVLGCGQLKTVTLPKNLEVEGVAGGIVNCYRLSEYKTPEDCVNFEAIDGVVYSKGDHSTLYFFPPAKEVAEGKYTVANWVKTIERGAFLGTSTIKEVTIPANVETIIVAAFQSMSNLTKINFEEPSGIQTIGKSAFGWCPALKEVTLPSSLTVLNAIFSSSANLETINVPAGSKLTTIMPGAFQTNTKLKNFNFLGDCDLTTIGAGAFQNLSLLQEFNFPKGVTTIGANAFNGCTSMTTVTFDENAVITTIGAGAMADCGLTSIDIPNSVTTLEREAFRNCAALTVVNVSENLTNISSEAFKYCENLVDINVDKKNPTYSSVDGYLLSKDKKTLVLFPHGKAHDKFTLLPPSITKIGDYAFYECENLTSVMIPNKVTSIGVRAFSLCNKLTDIAFLCDVPIDPANIDQRPNYMSFDNGDAGTINMPQQINIYVRKDIKNQYDAIPFYNNFNSIQPSFVEDGNEYLQVAARVADLLSVKSENYTFVVPEKTESGLEVGLIGDYAFQTASNKIKEVVIKNNIEYVGAQAFMTDIENNTSTIENVFFISNAPSKKMLSTTRFELDETGTNYKEFASTTNIYVKKSVADIYKNEWKKQRWDTATGTMQDSPAEYQFYNQIDYRIPDVSIKTKYGTFAREFDTDFSDYFTTSEKSEVAAFVAGSPIKVGNGDYGTSTHKVTMTSIDENGGVEGNYGYIPAYTGVLLKVLNKVETDAGFYYTIGEKDDVSYDITNNIMNECTVNYKEVFASEDDPIYVMQGGVFRKATAPITKFPVHKAYMKPGTIGAGAKIMFVFDDEETVTSLDEIIASDVRKDSNDYYNLNGQRVENPQQGIYIKNGKKIVIK